MNCETQNITFEKKDYEDAFDTDRKYVVYKHTSPVGKVYIGITGRKPEARWNNGNGYRGQIHFWNAIQKYGWDNIKHEIIESGLTEKEAKQKEIYYIALYDSTNRKKGYNRSLGGNMASIETKQIISQNSLKMWQDEEYRRKQSNILKERWSDPEYKEKQSRLIKKRWENIEYRQKQSQAVKKFWSDNEHRQKHIEKLRNCKPRSAESRIRYSEARKGKKLSEEAKRKLSEKAKTRVGEKSARSKTVLAFSIAEYENPKEFINARQAASYYGLSLNTISAVCRKPSGYSIGMRFCYQKDFEERLKYWTTLDAQANRTERKFYGNTKKPCLVFDIVSLNIIMEFASTKEASQYLGVDYATVNSACIKSRQGGDGFCNGKLVCYKEDEASVLTNWRAMRSKDDFRYYRTPVINIETGEVFMSAQEADKAYGKRTSKRVQNLMLGKCKSAYGHHWKRAF